MNLRTGLPPQPAAPRTLPAALPFAGTPTFDPSQTYQQVSAARRAKGRWKRVVGRLVLLVVVVAFGGALFVLGKTLLKDDELPSFSGTAPAYGTAVVSVQDTDANDARTTLVITANGAGTGMNLQVMEGAASVGFENAASDGLSLFVYSSAEGWRRGLVTTDAAALFWYAQVHQFDEWIPDVLRPYSDVRSHETKDLSGKSLEVWELGIDIDEFKDEHPTAFRQWADQIGASSDSGTARLVLWTDDQGTVWRVETWDDVTKGTSSVTVQSIAPEAYVPILPLTYFDVTTGQFVGG